jgi:hypothetical protein
MKTWIFQDFEDFEDFHDILNGHEGILPKKK